MSSKKGMEMTLGTLAIAAIVLVVVVVSVVMITRSSSKFNQAINSCEQNGGKCTLRSDCDSAELNYECKTPRICCSRSSDFA